MKWSIGMMLQGREDDDNWAQELHDLVHHFTAVIFLSPVPFWAPNVPLGLPQIDVLTRVSM